MQQYPYAFNGLGYSYVKIIGHVLGNRYTSVQLEDGVAFYCKEDNQRFLKLVDDDKQFILYFDVPMTDSRQIQTEELYDDSETPKWTVWSFKAHSIEQVITHVEMAAKDHEE